MDNFRFLLVNWLARPFRNSCHAVFETFYTHLGDATGCEYRRLYATGALNGSLRIDSTAGGCSSGFPQTQKVRLGSNSRGTLSSIPYTAQKELAYIKRAVGYRSSKHSEKPSCAIGECKQVPSGVS
ncbi:hypothetical protein Trydic_g20330 [Trypoxylus dichotomus]